MTTAEVIAKTLISEHADFLRQAVTIVAAQLIETSGTRAGAAPRAAATDGAGAGRGRG